MASVIVLVDSIPLGEGGGDGSPPAEFGLLLDLACAVAGPLGGAVRVLSIVEAAADESLSTGALAAQERRKRIAAWNRAWADAYREQLAAAGRYSPGSPDPLPDIQPVVSVAPAGHHWPDIAAAIRQQEGSLILAVTQVAGAATDGAGLLQHDLPCDTAVVRPALRLRAAGAAATSFQAAQVLLPARGGPHASLALRLAGALVTGRGATLALLHVLQQDLPERQRTREERPFAALLAQAGLGPTTRQIWAVGRSVGETILQQAGGYDVLLLGAPVGQPGAEFSLGRVATTILKHAEALVVIVKTAVSAEPAI